MNESLRVISSRTAQIFCPASECSSHSLLSDGWPFGNLRLGAVIGQSVTSCCSIHHLTSVGMRTLKFSGNCASSSVIWSFILILVCVKRSGSTRTPTRDIRTRTGINRHSIFHTRSNSCADNCGRCHPSNCHVVVPSPVAYETAVGSSPGNRPNSPIISFSVLISEHLLAL